MSGRVPRDPRLTKNGILAEERELRAERRRAQERTTPRYQGEIGAPFPGEFDDLRAVEGTDWDQIEEESSPA